jgi:hypothetical protein
VTVNEYTLPALPCRMQRYQVTVTLSRPEGYEALFPPGGQAVVELAAAAVAVAAANGSNHIALRCP